MGGLPGHENRLTYCAKWGPRYQQRPGFHAKSLGTIARNITFVLALVCNYNENSNFDPVTPDAIIALLDSPNHSGSARPEGKKRFFC